MRPALLVAAIVSQLLRLAFQGQGGPPGQQGGVVGAWGAFVWFVLVPIAILLLPGVFVGHVYLLVPIAAIAALTFPWPIARSVLVPLGQPKLAYWLAYTSDFVFRGDRRGGAALAAAWAIARQGRPDEEAIDWVSARLAEPKETLRGAGVLAGGLLLAARGDLEGARAVIQSVRELDERACPKAARRLANAWLLADAAARGAWREALGLAHTLDETGREGWLVAGVARALLLEAFTPTRAGLWLRWAIAPRRRETLAIVRRAVSALDGAFIEPDEAPSPPAPDEEIDAGDALSTALARHASVLTLPRGALTAADLAAAGKAWDVVLGDRSTERALHERALVIGATGASAAFDRLRASVEGDLAAAALAAGVKLTELEGKGEVAERIRLQLRDRLLTEVEAASDAIRRRVDDKRELGPLDEWREWTMLRLAYEKGVAGAGDDFRRLAFLKVYHDASSLACWLFNDREQRPLGNAVFRFLLREAEALDDARAVALQAKNVACGV